MEGVKELTTNAKCRVAKARAINPKKKKKWGSYFFLFCALLMVEYTCFSSNNDWDTYYI